MNEHRDGAQSVTTIAFIGLGNMGLPMASRLLAAGYSVSGFDVSERARDRLRQAGGVVGDTLESVGHSAEVVITMLPDGQVVQQALAEIEPHLRPGVILIDMGSSDPVTTREVGATLIENGFEFIDAPVSGGVKRAVDGSLSIMAGGAEATIQKVDPLLLTMGRVVYRTGPLGSGHAVKELNNYVSGAGLVAALEALHVAKTFGIDPNLLVDVLNASTGKNNSTEVKLKQFVISEQYNSGFFLGLMAKDIRTAQKLAAQLKVPLPMGGTCADVWDASARSLGADQDHTAIYRYLTDPTTSVSS